MRPICIFCQIVQGKIDSARLWENSEFLAILDINPNTPGMALVLTKQHYDSDVLDLPDRLYQKFLLVAKIIARLLAKGLRVSRVALVAEGMGINHAHIKLYPLHGVKKEFNEMWAKQRKFFSRYEGYLSTQLGPPADMAVLKMLAKKIRQRTTS